MRNSTDHSFARAARLLGSVFLALAVLVAPTSGYAQEAPAVDASRTQLEQAQAQLDALHYEEELLAEEYNGAAVVLEQTRKELVHTQEDIKTYTKMAADAQAELETRAADAYRAGIGSRLQAIFDGGTFDDVSDRVFFLSSMMDQIQGVAVQAQGATASAQEAAAYLHDSQLEIQAQRTILDRNRRAIEANVAEQEVLIDRFQTQLDDALAAAKLARLAPDPGDPRWPVGPGDAGITDPPPPVSPKAQIAIDLALDQVGKAYVWAADGPDSFDCSGLTMFAWAKAGVHLYHHAQTQYDSLPHVLTSQVAPGDLVFYGTGTTGITHVAMYIGTNRIVQAENTQVGVVISSFSSFWTSGYVGAARPG